MQTMRARLESSTVRLVFREVESITYLARIESSGIKLQMVIGQTELMATEQLRERERSHIECNSAMGRESTLQCTSQM